MLHCLYFQIGVCWGASVAHVFEAVFVSVFGNSVIRWKPSLVPYLGLCWCERSTCIIRPSVKLQNCTLHWYLSAICSALLAIYVHCITHCKIHIAKDWNILQNSAKYSKILQNTAKYCTIYTTLESALYHTKNTVLWNINFTMQFAHHSKTTHLKLNYCEEN